MKTISAVNGMLHGDRQTDELAWGNYCRALKIFKQTHFVFLPLYTTAMAVKTMFKHFFRVLDDIRSLVGALLPLQ
jgi:hypothetical protein